jgi:O-glycosyl hydrolase
MPELAAPAASRADAVSSVLSAKAFPSKAQPARLVQEPSVPFRAAGPDPAVPTVLLLNSSATGQTILGFGGAITDSVASVFGRLSPALQDEFLQAIWGRAGQRYNLGRLTIGATDFSTSVYSYSNSTGDYAMVNFSIGKAGGGGKGSFACPEALEAQTGSPFVIPLLRPMSRPGLALVRPSRCCW